MCLAVPGKVTEVFEREGLKFGRLDYSGTINEVCLEYVPEIQVGQYAIVHAGFAIQVLDEDEAKKTLALFEEMAEALEREDNASSVDPFADDDESDKPDQRPS